MAVLRGTPGNDTLTGGIEADLLNGLAGDDFLSGGDGDDELYGSGGDDLLVGGAGIDAMAGHGGNDVYVIDYVEDTIEEGVGGGIDTVRSPFTVNLRFKYFNVENIVLEGSEDSFGTGNSLNNHIAGNGNSNSLRGNDGNDRLLGKNSGDWLYGNSGNDTLDGGGAGDTLFGGAGSDRFLFDTALGAQNHDRIMDFATGLDTIVLSSRVFRALGGPGPLDPNFFVIGAAAADGNDFIIYDDATGRLYYDRDANGAGAQVHFATLQGNPVLSAADIDVV